MSYPRAVQVKNIKPEKRFCCRCNKSIRARGNTFILSVKKGKYHCFSCEEERKQESITVYKVCCEGDWCAYDNLDDAVKHLKREVEAEAAAVKPGEETRAYSIGVSQMTRKEYSSLPEFTGF